MMKAFQRFIALGILDLFTMKILSLFFGNIFSYDFKRIVSVIKERQNHAFEELKPSVPVFSIIAIIISLLFYVAMARELYIMYKLGKENIMGREKKDE